MAVFLVTACYLQNVAILNLDCVTFAWISLSETRRLIAIFVFSWGGAWCEIEVSYGSEVNEIGQ